MLLYRIECHLISCLFLYYSKCGSTNVPNTSAKVMNYCFTDMDVQDGDMSPNYFSLKKEVDKNCSHIYGDVVLRGIVTADNGTDPDLNFLRSIKEITGSLLIKNTNVSLIPFTNLLVIRGKSRSRYQGNSINGNSIEIVMYMEQNKKQPLRTIFDFSKLRSISSGNIYLSPIVCQQLARMNSDELFEDPHNQHIKGNCSHAPFNCSSKCPLKHGKRYCWGPSHLQCQIFSKCEKEICPNRCYVSNTGREACCNEQCLGGCTSSLNESCIACGSVLNGKVCLNECPPKKEYNKTAKAYENNKNYKVTLINTCLEKCPDGFYDEEGICTSQCTIKNYEINGTKCVPCQQYCEHKCIMEDIFSEKHLANIQTSLDLNRLKKLSNCTTFRGSLFFNTDSFVRQAHLPDYEPITNPSDFWHLSNLRKITGSIFMDFRYATFNLNNLSFFSNLEIIEGNDREMPTSLAIINSKINFLGFRSLTTIGMKGHTPKIIQIVNNTNMCYFDPVKFKSIFKFKEDITFWDSKNNTLCVAEGMVCSNQCDSDFGCSGPGPTYCYKCAKKKLGNLCADTCTSASSYYQNKTDANNTVCIKCHNECAFTCSGQRSDECIGGCKNALEGQNCVLQCSRTHFLNNKTMKCERCNPDCHQRHLTRLPICTGPSSIPGLGGCNKCQALILDRNDDIIKCTNNNNQIDMFNENHPNTIESIFSVFTEKFTDLIIMYKPCHPLCSKCTFDTAQRIKAPYPSETWNGCIHCNGYWHLNVCVMKCPKNFTYVRHDQNNSSKGECPLCHPQCHGCYGGGNDQCFKCSNLLLHDTLNKSKFTCVNSCPLSYKEKFFDDQLNETICLKVHLSSLEWIVIIIVTVIFLLIMTFIFIILRLWTSRKTKRRKNKINAYFSNANEEDSNNFIQANMNKLSVINAENIEYDPNADPLGKGAFGTVYFGRWKPTDQDFDDNSSINSCKREKVDVAIKLVNQSCSVNEFMDEVKIMASVRHKHCLRLIGLSYKDNKPLLITGFINLGSMDKYLLNNKAKLVGKILLLWAEQIADGMLYLERNHIIHRDLATRNVLISKEDYVQITDFGLAKVLTTELIRIPSGIVPVRWLAIESIRDGEYSHKTDVWAYAVTLWEIFTFAQTPYHPIKANEIREEIIKGTRLCQPEICSLEIYILMLKCWSVDPSDRPSFEYLWNEFKTYCDKPKKYLSYPNNNESRPSKMNSRKNNSMNNNYLQIRGTKEAEFIELSNCTYQDTLDMSPSEESIILRTSPLDMKIPSKIIPLLSDRPTRNNLYQPADDLCKPLIDNNQDQEGLIGQNWQNDDVPQSDRHGRQDISLNNSLWTNMTEYMEPRNLKHLSNEGW